MTAINATLLTSLGLGAPTVLGCTEPRIWTPPLRELTPETSDGFELNEFAADVLETPFDPWQEWLSIHARELLPDGRPRFRIVLVLVARQNGKSLWGHALVKNWLFVERAPLVLGTSTDRTYAKKAWAKICEESQANPWLSRKLGPKAQRLTIGEEALTTTDGAEYFFAANNGRAGRSMTLHRWLCDELREHHTRDAWDSASNAMAAVPDGQIVCITNQGDDQSVMLDELREAALRFIRTGEGDPRIGLFEWSAPDGASPTDLDALAQANPNLGRRLDADALVAAGARALAKGGEALTGFRTEAMCQRVHLLDPAIDPHHWGDCRDPGDLSAVRSGVALCFDVSLDGQHATLAAAAMLSDERVRVEVVAAWDDMAALRRELPAYVRKIRPRALGWFPNGPAAAVAVALAKRKGWPPAGVEVEAIRGEVTQVCMGFAELVESRELAHSGDPLLDAHVEATERQERGDAWVFTRGAGHCDATYAAAGAVHLARTLPTSPGKPRLVVARHGEG